LSADNGGGSTLLCLKDASGTQGGVQQGGQDSNDFVVPMRREHSNYNSSECRCIRYFSQFVKSLAPLFLWGFSTGSQLCILVKVFMHMIAMTFPSRRCCSPAFSPLKH